MGTHPNAILLCRLTPDGLQRKTHRAILEEAGTKDDDDIKIGSEEYHHSLLEDTYNDNWQISGKEGDILVFYLITYGYGDAITWSKLEAQKKELEAWAQGICERHKCTFEILITANYW